MSIRLHLASTSPARLAVLNAAGIKASTFTPQINEQEELTKAEKNSGKKLSPAEVTLFLARKKAEDVANRHTTELDGLLLGGDSIFYMDEEILGKPHQPEIAFTRAKKHRGKTGTLYSGHWLIDCRHGKIGTARGRVETALVTMAKDVSDSELERYIATGEPLKLAGGFAIDGLAGAFIEKIDGAPSTVIGLSLPGLRKLVKELGYNYTDLWNQN